MDAKGDRLQFRISGMTCGACAQRVERAMRDVEGVEDASVNLLAESATVRVRDRDLSPRLVERVRAVGYEAESVAAGRELLDQLSSDQRHRESLRRHRQALVQAIGLALPVIALDYLIPGLWGKAAAEQVPGRLMQIVLLVMLAISPAGAPILVGGLRAILHRAGNMELLITTGVVAAFVSGVYGTIAQDTAFIHFHAAAMILAIVCVGRYLEARARGRATAAISALARRAPKEAIVQRDDAWVTIPADRVERGDCVRVPVHTAIPVDGEVIDGH
ncbi:MAG: cation-translocating P-type ATPase, partial [Phycisphaerales bacterium]|nr:cation-translocating P-type ATPase [Phycisphaerales bacterium]